MTANVMVNSPVAIDLTEQSSIVRTGIAVGTTTGNAAQKVLSLQIALQGRQYPLT